MEGGFDIGGEYGIYCDNEFVMKTLTVFTPAYNRAHTIGRTYESLCRQTLQDFEWLVVDDGSSDNTRELVEGWIKENRIPIRYIYQDNQGMHGAHNTAYKNIYTELNTCIDSDDYMPNDAVEKIVGSWQNLSESQREKYAGLMGLDKSISGGIIGDSFSASQKEITLNSFYARGGRGDKKLVIRTDVVKCYPEYPRFENEKYFSLGWLYLLIDQDYKWITINEPLVTVDYQPEGSSYGMYKQYWNNPKGFSFLRKEHMRYGSSARRMFFTCTHYVASSIIGKDKLFIKKSPRPLMTVIAIPGGVLLYLIIRNKVNKGVTMKLK